MAGPSRGSLASTASDRTLKVLSFNVWGLAIIAKERNTRIRAIAQYLASSSYDIVCLQECWVYKDFELIRGEVISSLPYSRFFNSGALGSGLAIFTRYPLVSAQVMPFDLSGTPQQAFAGDFFVNKAAGNVVIAHPVLGEVEIWTTHMHAGGEHAPDTRQAHRIGEGWQLANAVLSGAAKGRYVMAMGDFNAQPFSVPIGLMRTHAGMTDSFLETHPHADQLDPLPLSPEIAMNANGMSCDSPLNTWSAAKNIPPNIRSQGGKRLDYIFYRQPGGVGPSTKTGAGDRPVSLQSEDTEIIGGQGRSGEERPSLRCVKCELVLTEMVPGKAFSYSDHFGLFATFEIGVDSPSNPFTSPGRRTSKRDLPTTFTPALSHLAQTSSVSTTSTSPPSSAFQTDYIRRAKTTLTSYALLSQSSARLHNRISLACLVVLVGLAVGSAWQPKSYIQPVFTIVAGLLGAAAATFFYLGFVWGRWEAGILAEVTQEMDLELEVISRR